MRTTTAVSREKLARVPMELGDENGLMPLSIPVPVANGALGPPLSLILDPSCCGAVPDAASSECAVVWLFGKSGDDADEWGNVLPPGVRGSRGGEGNEMGDGERCGWSRLELGCMGAAARTLEDEKGRSSSARGRPAAADMESPTAPLVCGERAVLPTGSNFLFVREDSAGLPDGGFPSWSAGGGVTGSVLATGVVRDVVRDVETMTSSNLVSTVSALLLIWPILVFALMVFCSRIADEIEVVVLQED